MFTSVDNPSLVQDIRLNCPNGEVFDYSDPSGNSSIALIKDVFINSCTKFGTFDSLTSLVLTDTSCFNATQGITLIGSGWRVWRFQDIGMLAPSNAAFVGIDMGTASCAGILFQTSLWGMVAGGIAIKGAAASGNVNAGTIGRVANMVLTAGGDPLDTISPDDSRWVFVDNDQIKDTNPEAFSYMRSNATPTVISTINTPVLLAGTWTEGTHSQFETSAAGRITYTGEREVELPISVTMTAQTVSGGDKDVTYYLSKNGVVDNNTGQPDNIKIGKPSNTTLLWQDTWTTGDYYEIWVENNDGTENILGSDVKFVVN